MHDLLGPLLFQFEYLNRQKMPSQKKFLERLEEFVGVDREVDPLVEATAIFKAENRAKAKGGGMAPGRM
jgi:hypothetical protein